MPIARIKLPFSSIPVIPPPVPDARLRAGSLALLNPMDPYNPWPAGVPANGGTVPNLAYVQLAALLGAGNATTLALPVVRSGLTAGTGLVERTVKGGLHVIFSQTLNASSADNFTIEMPAALRTYLFTNYDHALFLSMWNRVTRAATGLTYYAFLANTALAMASNYKQNIASDKVNPIEAGSGFLGRRDSAQTVGGHQLNTGRSGHSGGAPASSAALSTALFTVGNYGTNANNTVAQRGKAASMAIYQVYLEDLTVSGRSYATADAEDLAAYNSWLVNPAGAYYGDTIPTAPSTIP